MPNGKQGKLIGWKKCRWCGDKDAEVRDDKKGNPYAVCYACPEGVSQDFTYGRAQRLGVFAREGFRPVDASNVPAWAKPAEAAPAPKPAPASKPAGDPAPAAAKKDSGLLL